jgi:hypothetical protein
MYDTVEVPPDAPDALEHVGSKRKFWYTRSLNDSEEEWLFKAARQNTGEDWAEKVAAELCELIKLPHASYQLATWTEEKNGDSTEWDGVVTRRIQERDERLLLGNEILAGPVNRYPRAEGNRFYVNPKYTLDLTLRILGGDELNIRLDPDWPLPEEVTTVPGAFLGFLLLDAWTGNTDRHDNNWGVLERSTPDGPIRYLAPTFDHASSLGRELTDEVRHERLTTNDKNRTVEAYVKRCRSAFVREEDVEETIHPTEVFQQAAALYPDAAAAWLHRLESLQPAAVEAIFDRIPEARISDVSIDFALRQLQLNRDALLDLDV